MTIPQTVCPECGVFNEINETECWNCKRSISDQEIQEARDGFLNDLSDQERNEFLEGEKRKESSNNGDELGFQWWKIWAWLGLTLGNLYMFGVLSEQIGLAIFLILLNSMLMIMILKFNKYAFLIATILSFNPLLWIINGIYLKNRWDHPKVNMPLNG